METFLLKSTCIDLLAPSPSTKTKTGSCLEFLLSYQSCPRMARSLPQVLTPASPASDLHLARVATAIAIERTPGLHKAPFSDPLALVLSLLSHRLIHTREKLDCDSRPSVPDSHPQPKWQCPQNQGEAAVHFGHKGALWIRAPSPPALTPALTKAVTPCTRGEASGHTSFGSSPSSSSPTACQGSGPHCPSGEDVVHACFRYSPSVKVTGHTQTAWGCSQRKTHLLDWNRLLFHWIS